MFFVVVVVVVIISRNLGDISGAIEHRPSLCRRKVKEKNPTSPKSVKLICTKQAPSAGMSLGQKKKEGGSCISRIKLLYSGMNGDPRLLSHIDSLSSDTLLQLMLRSIQKFRLKKNPHKT